MQARSQVYAAKIYDLVASLKQRLARKEQKRYGSLCHRFPLIVRENGLAAAFGFLAAKGGGNTSSPENLLLGHYAEVLAFQNTGAMQDSVIRAQLPEYRRLTQQALMLAEWFKRYAEGVLKVDPTGESIGGEETNDSDAP